MMRIWPRKSGPGDPGHGPGPRGNSGTRSGWGGPGPGPGGDRASRWSTANRQGTLSGHYFRYTYGSLDGRYSSLSPNPHGPGLMAPALTSLHLGPWTPGHEVAPHGHQAGPPGCVSGAKLGKGDMIVIRSGADCHTGCHTRDSSHRDNHRPLIGLRDQSKLSHWLIIPRSHTDCH